MARFCDQNCLKVGWTQRGHKEQCKKLIEMRAGYGPHHLPVDCQVINGAYVPHPEQLVPSVSNIQRKKNMVSAFMAFLSVKHERLGKHSVAKLIAKEEGIQRLIWTFLRPKMPNR